MRAGYRPGSGHRFRLMSRATGQSVEVARSHRQDEARSHPLDAATEGLGHAADGLGPAEGLLDPFPVLLGQGIALVPGGAAIDGGVFLKFAGNFQSAWTGKVIPRRSTTASESSHLSQRRPERTQRASGAAAPIGGRP